MMPYPTQGLLSFNFQAQAMLEMRRGEGGEGRRREVVGRGEGVREREEGGVHTIKQNNNRL